MRGSWKRKGEKGRAGKEDADKTLLSSNRRDVLYV
jgi:hypothetical protein